MVCVSLARIAASARAAASARSAACRAGSTRTPGSGAGSMRRMPVRPGARQVPTRPEVAPLLPRPRRGRPRVGRHARCASRGSPRWRSRGSPRGGWTASWAGERSGRRSGHRRGGTVSGPRGGTLLARRRTRTRLGGNRLRVTAQPLALPALRGLARLALLGSHGRPRSGSAPGGTSGSYKSVPPEITPVAALTVAAGHAGHTAAMAWPGRDMKWGGGCGFVLTAGARATRITAVGLRRLRHTAGLPGLQARAFPAAVGGRMLLTINTGVLADGPWVGEVGEGEG